MNANVYLCMIRRNSIEFLDSLLNRFTFSLWNCYHSLSNEEEKKREATNKHEKQHLSDQRRERAWKVCAMAPVRGKKTTIIAIALLAIWFTLLTRLMLRRLFNRNLSMFGYLMVDCAKRFFPFIPFCRKMGNCSTLFTRILNRLWIRRNISETKGEHACCKQQQQTLHKEFPSFSASERQVKLETTSLLHEREGGGGGCRKKNRGRKKFLTELWVKRNETLLLNVAVVYIFFAHQYLVSSIILLPPDFITKVNWKWIFTRITKTTIPTGRTFLLHTTA